MRSDLSGKIIITEMEKGDRFICYGKVGVTKGIVAKRYSKTVYDLRNRVKLVINYIISERGEKYRESDCLKIESEIKPTLFIRLISLFNTF